MSEATAINELSLLHRLEKFARGLVEDEHLNLGLNDAWDLKVTLDALDKLRSADAMTVKDGE